MKTVIPYAPGLLRPETAEFAASVDGRCYAMMGEFDYWSLFYGLWDSGEEFAIVEQDIVPTLAQWEAMRDCPQPWCASEYLRFGVVTATLGFAKFRPGDLGGIRLEQWNAGGYTQAERERFLLAANPPQTANIPWGMVDGVVWTFLTQRGFAPHRHAGLVQHLRRPEL